MELSKNIKDKVVIITGASSGLGESTARHLASLEANVVSADENLSIFSIQEFGYL